MAKASLLARGVMDTCELARHILKAKNLNEGDKVLAKAITFKLIHALRQ